MTFLQPSLLIWILPASALPLIIHLLNRLRFRSVRWGAMMFVVSALRSSIKRARLRNYIILLCRMLLLALLALAMARPMTGGWLSHYARMTGGVVVILLDRSASMEAKVLEGQHNKRSRALEILSQIIQNSATRFVLIENVLLHPYEIAPTTDLTKLSITTPTDTSADIPTMFRIAVDFLIKTQPASAEICVVSDLQESNWRPTSKEWQTITSQLLALPCAPKITVFVLSTRIANNGILSFKNVTSLKRNGKTQLVVTAELHQNYATAISSLPLIATINGNRFQSELQISSPVLRFHKEFDFGTDMQTSSWGKLEIPDDNNPRDNYLFFVFAPTPPPHVMVVAEDLETRRRLYLSATASLIGTDGKCESITSEQLSKVNWQESSLVLCQIPLKNIVQSDNSIYDSVTNFVHSGGQIILFPSGISDTNTLFGIRWGEVENADSEQHFKISSWEEHEGPVARTIDGINLPVDKLVVRRRQLILTDKNELSSETHITSQQSHSTRIWAWFSDGKPFLISKKIGRGAIFFCATLPSREWSGLGDGEVLVPLTQRGLREGSSRFSSAMVETCGTWMPANENELWETVDSEKPKNPKWDAGIYIYRNANKILALNRPSIEDTIECISSEEIPQLLPGVKVEIVSKAGEKHSDSRAVEIWHIFVLLAIIVMLMELWLSVHSVSKTTVQKTE